MNLMKMNKFMTIFTCPKITPNHSNLYWTFTANIRKQPVSFSLLPMHEAMDQSGTPLGLMLRPTSICQAQVNKGKAV